MSDSNRNIIDLTTESALAEGLRDIANAIGKFKLNAGAVTVANGAFTLLYEGDAPQTAPTTATVIADIKGTNQTGLSYTVSYSNGVATFTLSGAADGVYTQAVSAVVVLGDYSVPITITGLPVMYDVFVEYPQEGVYNAQNNSISFSAQVYPKNVSPAPNFNQPLDPEDFSDNVLSGALYELNLETGNLDYVDLGIYLGFDNDNGFTVTLPANTIQSGHQYWLWVDFVHFTEVEEEVWEGTGAVYMIGISVEEENE